MSSFIEKITLEALALEETKKPIIENKDYLSLISDVKVSLEVTVGKVSMTLDELKKLKENQVLCLDKLSNEPVELLLNGKRIGLGELVLSDNNYGIKLLKISVQP